MSDFTVTVNDVVLTKEALQSIKKFQEDNGSYDQRILDEIVDILLEDDPADNDIKHRLKLIQEIRFISKNLKSLSPNTREEVIHGC